MDSRSPLRAVGRALVATAVAVATFYFVFWVGGAFLLQFALPKLLHIVGSLAIASAMAVIMTRYLLTRPPSNNAGLMRAIAVGALATGAIGFVGGFFGPLIFRPGANQGPMLGIFVTGPIGFIAGAVGGAVFYWRSQRTPSVVREFIAGGIVLVTIAFLFVRYPQVSIITSAIAGAAPGEVATGDTAMVVSASPAASLVGARILRAGGNAIDAAVSVAFALAVTYPTAGNIGGGGLMLARMNGQTVALDFREVAPLAATRDMYLDAKGHVTDRSVTGALAVGVPGSVAGLWAAHQKFGKLPWRDVIQPAIDLAEKGVAADLAFSEDLRADLPRFAKFAGSAALFSPGGVPIPRDSVFKNPDLARTLRLIAAQGAKGFYEGETAQKFVDEMKRDGGIISLEDLKSYEPKWRTPVEFTYRGYRVLTMPPVSSGGLTLALISGIVSGYDLHAMGFHSADAIHVMAEAERVAYMRRNTLLADPDFVPTPMAPFMSSDTAAALRQRIAMAKHSPTAVAPDPVRGKHTTHLAVVDGKGNAVSLTTTLNTGHGSAVTVSGAGFLLNNEMDDFTAKVGAINQMGLRQGEANAIVPGKRMLSSMTPTIVLDSAGATFLVVGAAGGARIITAVMQIISNVIDFQRPIGEAVGAPRFHAQDFPDTLEMSASKFPDSTVKALTARGHHVSLKTDRGWTFGWAQAILRSGGHWQGATEPRGHGMAAGY